jgi:hypothetical protein
MSTDSETTRSTASISDELAYLLHIDGAYCGDCSYDDAVDKRRNGSLKWSCSDCKLCLTGYVSAILAEFTVTRPIPEKLEGATS